MQKTHQCPNCGSSEWVGLKFCTNCGVRLKSIKPVKLFVSIFVTMLVLAAILFAVPLSDLDSSAVLAAYDTGGSATGLGDPISQDGNWFMYNSYPGSDTGTYDIQAGNPAGGTNIVGSYQVTNNGDGTYTVTYSMNPGVNVTGEHLGISDTPSFTGVPGQDDNQDFGASFNDDNGSFYVFAHFSVEY